MDSPTFTRVFLNCTLMESGTKFVQMIGVLMRQRWLADRWVLLVLLSVMCPTAGKGLVLRKTCWLTLTVQGVSQTSPVAISDSI
jgi:hypothetical protein